MQWRRDAQILRDIRIDEGGPEGAAIVAEDGPHGDASGAD